MPIYFEKIERIVPSDSSSAKIGVGTFKAELWLLTFIGFDFVNYSKAGLDTASFAFDVIFPFIILFIVSLLTRPNSEKVLREFYARVHTPAIADATADAIEVRKRIDDTELVEQNKLFPHTNWEFWKPTRTDITGFILCWVGVAVIILLYVWIMNIGS